ncbi:hypothetical protein M408DRAFT_75223 [Serendipita vermifera MAFF 305830]|uniref:Uncharacterized protein n=1 Tax=Serendipita vermifera MAFF 305830 TaxID=933852 RepID=A0A0C3B032_SERVB|nr:hypothetical protein M408DRAFT_75223 [Serendipita vermifera MAFF 305830]
MSSEEVAFYEKEKERLVKEISKVVEEIALTINNINRSQEGTVTLARDKVTGEMNMWKHLRDLGEAKAKDRADELLASSGPHTEAFSASAGSNRALSSSTSGDATPRAQS